MQRSSRRGIRSLLVCAAVLGCASRQQRVDMDCVQGISGRSASFTAVDPERVAARLDALQLANALRELTLERLFREAGCAEQLRVLPVLGSELPNLVCTLPGRSERRIVVGAHYDKVAAGEGAADNWSSAALLPTLYESLRSSEREYSYDFIAFTDEEKGLIGSRSYVQQLPLGERGQIAAMVNLDTLGLGITNVEQRASDPRLYCLFSAAASSIEIAARPVNVDRVGTSDFLSFREVGIPVVSLHSLTQESLPILHSDRDQLSAIDRPAYYQSYRLIALYLALLDLGLPASPVSAPAGG